MRLFTKALCCLVMMAMVFSFASAEEEGVFVPTYSTFMNRLCEHAPDGYGEVIRVGLMKDGAWKDGFMSSFDLIGKNMLKLTRTVKSGYVYSFEVTISEEAFATHRLVYDQMITAVMKALRSDFSEDDASKMKDTLLITTITTTPVNYMYQSTNEGVYRYGFTKRNGEYIFSIEFALQ